MNLPKQIQFYLRLRGMTAAELARKAGVSKQVISQWANGSRPRDVEQVKKVADAFGTTVDSLLFGSGKDMSAERVTELDALLGSEWISGLFEVKFRRIKR